MEVDVGAGVSVGAGVLVAIAVFVGIFVGGLVDIGVTVGPNNCPGPHADKIKLEINNKLDKRLKLFFTICAPSWILVLVCQLYVMFCSIYQVLVI